MRNLLLSLACISTAFGQVVPTPIFPTELRQYLELTPSQVEAIVRLNTDYNRNVQQKTQRIFQVQREIRDETTRDAIDPTALGIRYAEIEYLQRQMKDELARVRDDARKVLNDAQRAKLKMLEDAMKLQPIINEAVCENLLTPPQPVPLVTLQPLNGTVAGFFDVGAQLFGCFVRGPVPLQPGP